MELKNCPRCDQELEFGKRHTGCGPKESRIQGKPRMAWSAEMQQRFVSAVNRLGIQEATPMKIVSLMNIEGLTRDHVRGRLDSYRSRLRMGATPIRMPHNWNAYPAAYPGQAGYPWHMEYHMAPDAGYRVPVPGSFNPVGQLPHMVEARGSDIAPRGWFPPPPAGPPPIRPFAPPLGPPRTRLPAPPPEPPLRPRHGPPTCAIMKDTAGGNVPTKNISESGMSKNAARTAAIEINSRLSAATTVEDILGVLAQVDVEGQTFDGVCLATAFHKLAKRCAGCVTKDGRPSDHCKLAAVQSEEFRGLMRVAMKKEMKVRNLSNVLWSCAKMMPAIEQCKDLRSVIGKLVSSVSSQLAMASEGKDTVVPQNLSNIMWSLPELRVSQLEGADLAACVAQIERHVVTLVARFEPQHISNTLLSFAKLNHRPARETMDALEAQISNMDVDRWTPQALSNSLYALGCLNAGKPLTVHELLIASMRKAGEFSPKHAAMSLKGFALREQAPNDSKRVAAKSVLGCLERFASIVANSSPKHPSPATPQNLSDTAWSLARLGIRDKCIFETICSRFLGAELSGDGSIGSMHATPSAIIDMIWACGKVDILLPDAFKDWAIRRLNK
jgi:SHAQKYF class myb-like DNA-binding protein